MFEKSTKGIVPSSISYNVPLAAAQTKLIPRGNVTALRGVYPTGGRSFFSQHKYVSQAIIMSTFVPAEWPGPQAGFLPLPYWGAPGGSSSLIQRPSDPPILQGVAPPGADH